ncbi:hypothetical protein, partial [Streptomyces vietnamensis]|uniref:hypothetical protein n=1 Tax=Streptomyces vietnamensis TaxID=362257 RepID=UPI0034306A34
EAADQFVLPSVHTDDRVTSGQNGRLTDRPRTPTSTRTGPGLPNRCPRGGPERHHGGASSSIVLGPMGAAALSIGALEHRPSNAAERSH